MAVIAQCVWLYYRFALSLRDVAELMLARSIVVSHETIRTWHAKFGRRMRVACAVVLLTNYGGGPV
ncbi:IS6 family transposase [Rhodococcus sp. AD45]|uniref:IS6 family transposase n=1 Tax=Rhodococcus sp. WS3 TaxID=2486271 RepID=UPI0005D3A387|nr:hypothetical protein SZ00_06220 [Rhodococcus sp. AD45]